MGVLEDLALISALIHPWGHVGVAARSDVPATVNYKTFSEEWDRDTAPGVQAGIHGGGFSTADRVGEMRNSPDYALANALYKAFYLAGGPEKLASNMWYKDGDMGGMRENSGNRHTDALLGVSMLADLAKAGGMMPNSNLRFDVIDGAPGLVYQHRW